MNKKQKRLIRAKRSHARSAYGITRVCVHRTPKHIYVQIIHKDVAGNSSVLAQSSSLGLAASNKKQQAQLVGQAFAKKYAREFSALPFDKSGFKYHGRISILAEILRESGIIT